LLLLLLALSIHLIIIITLTDSMDITSHIIIKTTHRLILNSLITTMGTIPSILILFINLLIVPTTNLIISIPALLYHYLKIILLLN
jgi:hypothetical protein